MRKPIGYYNYSVIATYASLAAASAGIYFVGRALSYGVRFAGHGGRQDSGKMQAQPG